MYYFHQFPVLFLVSNFIAVPLSSIILMGEIALCMLSWMPFVAGPLGSVLGWLLKIMNISVLELGRLPFSSFTGLLLVIPQVILMYAIIGCLAIWLMLKRKWALPAALVGGILFMAVRLI
jgi:competence protein ComEC